ncbi:UDP-forming cellulose synthase catalytic subunit [Ideonella sp. B7]|uniref:UDP-forming cellulose synthase catalytic subunit n=1 Tax=Ideonella benzenivorans TaxID=2831643 RepID=UPI001CED792E|nr:UDP-forming cellulose synthase catalytic subunit [Ideonella benzenivorans]MCA6216238.1 UDP-forming cellulose synthase catalytic subunit [Ideonella benzenivorans]
MSLQRLLWIGATLLQVERPAQLSCWLWRLFVRPPAGRAAVELSLDQVPDPLDGLARQLGLSRPAALWRWLLASLVLPAAARAAVALRRAAGWRRARQSLAWLATVLSPLARALAWGLGRVLGGALQLMGTALVLPGRWLLRGFDRAAATIDHSGLGPALARGLSPVLRQRGISTVLLVLAGVALVSVVTTPFNGLGQFLFLLLCWALALLLRRLPGRYPAIALATIGLLAMGRYAWWRLTTTLQFDSTVEALLGYGLLTAEVYTWLIFLLGFIQTIYPLQRQPAPLPEDRHLWPTVDVFIPTFNEPTSVVQPTLLAALSMDWPADKLKIYLLDDGRREEMRALAERLGVQYLSRPDNRHAKAGNLNHALQFSHGELVAVFDADHIPTRSFLKSSVGWFLKDPKCAMVQTPHHFFSPDPFERNLGTFRRVPNEGSLFYGLVQDGNDFWNATFFCGSCALLRRAPLMEVGGIAVETVTEDAHTALKLHRHGYSTAYIHQTQAAGLATESLSAHVGQRIRWARGMAQILRVDNPLLGKGLSLWQRLCYVNAMLHFLFGLPRLVFLTAPMAYLFFDWHIIHASSLMVALYVVPYMLLATIANAHVQGEHRHSFWAEVYETVLAWYIVLPTTVALLAPQHGKFNVTAKGGLVEKPYFDWSISTPYIVLVGLNLAAAITGLLRLTVFSSPEPATVVLNLVWTLYSLLMLGAAIGVASESRQVRHYQRVNTRLPATLYLPDGRVLRCECTDYAMSGLGLSGLGALSLQRGETVQVGLWRDGRECVFPGEISNLHQGMAGVRLDHLSLAQQVELVQCTFARPQAWQGWHLTHEQDHPMRGLKEITLLGLDGYRKLAHTLRERLQAWRDARQQRRVAPSLPVLPLR